MPGQEDAITYSQHQEFNLQKLAEAKQAIPKSKLLTDITESLALGCHQHVHTYAEWP